MEQRNADVEAGAKRPPAEIRADLLASSDRLAAAVRKMPEEAWSARVEFRGRRILAADLLWLRAREVWIHAIDLMPAPLVRRPAPPDAARLLTDATGTLGARPDFPRLILVLSDESRTGPWGGARPARAPRARGGARGLADGPLEGARPAHRRGKAAAGATVMAVIPDFTAVRAGRPARRISARGARRGGRLSCCPPRRGADRLDATHVELVTIDLPGSKDLDQALGVVRSAPASARTTPSPTSAPSSCRRGAGH